MNIQFNFQGLEHKADVQKFAEDQIEVVMKDNLERQFGSTLHYFVDENGISFTPLNPSHSVLYELQCEIKNAIVKQEIWRRK